MIPCSRCRFFNTNNLWVDLMALKREFKKNEGTLPLPVMKTLGIVSPSMTRNLKPVRATLWDPTTSLHLSLALCCSGTPRPWIPETRLPQRSCSWKRPWALQSSALKARRALLCAPQEPAFKTVLVKAAQTCAESNAESRL